MSLLRFYISGDLINFAIMKRIIVKTAPGLESMQPLARRIAVEGMPADAEIIYDERNRLFRVRHEGVAYIVKSFRRPNAVNRVAYVSVRAGKARRSFENALRLVRMGIDTPAPAAYMEVRRGGLLAESYYICRDVAAPQVRFWDRRSDGDAVASALAADIVRLHSAGVWHKDFSPGNILVESAGEGRYRFHYIDLNRMQFGVRGRARLMSMFGRMHDDEAPVRDLGRRYGLALEDMRAKGTLPSGVPPFMLAETAVSAAQAAAQSWRVFWQRVARKRRLRRLFRR